ncbi:hypothetical protein GPJ56_008956 [Histomonas meleagridis]|uniref:uncharacterized protein n=1 Tax=Histomonas meleagridis TaxID=135588 RepID=UPI00355A6DE8|nr:hypothetical protein GPJ56_008956 [Histomonas meleagridis]KAH0805689.1 hypothetical protein GO595_001530 [Histomonas meleagridis]
MIEAKDKNLTSWLGDVPKIPEEFKAFANFNEIYPEFSKQFNLDPEKAKLRLLSQKSSSKAHSFASYLCFCSDLYPVKLYQSIFINESSAKMLLYDFFSSINLEYTTIYQAAYLLLSRIAFPNNFNQIKLIFDTLAYAYHTANPYYAIDTTQISKVFASCVLYSVYRIGANQMYYETFKEYISDVGLSDETKKSIFDQISEIPIPIFLTFRLTSDQPMIDHSGYLRKSGSVRATKRYYKIDNLKMLVYDKKKLVKEFELAGCIARYIEQGPHEQRHIEIKTSDGKLIELKSGKKSEKEKEELTSWVDDINFVAFVGLLNKIFSEKN